LEEIIQLRKQETCDYQEYLAKIKELASKVVEPSSGESYPNSINTRAKQSLYDNLNSDEELATVLDRVIIDNKLDGWRDGGIKEKKLMLAVNRVISDPDKTLELMEIIKAQSGY
jgi:type I restriction enzyme, R subunit